MKRTIVLKMDSCPTWSRDFHKHSALCACALVETQTRHKGTKVRDLTCLFLSLKATTLVYKGIFPLKKNKANGAARTRGYIAATASLLQQHITASPKTAGVQYSKLVSSTSKSGV